MQENDGWSTNNIKRDVFYEEGVSFNVLVYTLFRDVYKKEGLMANSTAALQPYLVAISELHTKDCAELIIKV